MYIDRNQLEEYPFKGQFYTVGDTMPDDGDMLGDGNLLRGDDKEEEVVERAIDVVCEVDCDIQDANKAFASDTSGSHLDVYFPFDTEEGIEVRVGHRFKSDNWYRPVDGRVYSVIPTQMGGCVARLKEVGIDG